MAKFRFKPKKDVDTPHGWTNGERAKRSEASIRKHFSIRSRDKLEECNAQDMISDIGHLCDRNKWDFNEVIRMAKSNWEEER